MRCRDCGQIAVWVLFGRAWTQLCPTCPLLGWSGLEGHEWRLVWR